MDTRGMISPLYIRVKVVWAIDFEPFNFALHNLILPRLSFEEGCKICWSTLEHKSVANKKSETGRAFCTPLPRFSLVLQAFLISKISTTGLAGGML